jgi:hypothetical protein
MPKFKYVVYKITFPNGKIYIGKDVGGLGHSLRYFGSWNNEIVENDFDREAMRTFILQKEIIFETECKTECGIKEFEFIRFYQSNDASIGYNRSPRLRPIVC